MKRVSERRALGPAPPRVSPVVEAKRRPVPGFTNLQTVDLKALGVHGSPLAVLEDYRIRGPAFSGHPHAGFAAATYVLPDSPVGLRSRSSLGYDVIVGAGGVVWTHAGSGLVHEEVPASPSLEMHGLQVFVNLSAAHRLSAPQVMILQGTDVPVWRSRAGDHVFVVVGFFEDVASPLTPVEPFTFLDVRLRDTIKFPMTVDTNTVIYVLAGSLALRVGGEVLRIAADQAVAISRGDDLLTLEAERPSSLLLLSGLAITEPLVAVGPFIMNSRWQIEAAIARYRSGEMGGLSPT